MVKNNKINIRDITFIAITVSVIAIFSQISLPMPHGIPFTMQVFAVALAGAVLTPIQSIFCITIYIILALSGAPIFSNFGSGIDKLLGPTGGFIFGFYIITITSSIVKNKNTVFATTLIFLSTVIFHTIGIIQYRLITNTDWLKSILIISIPCFIKDIISIYCAHIFGRKIKNCIK